MQPQGNILSVLAFFIWIPIALWIARRWPPAKAASLLLLIPVLFLPELTSFKVPSLPAFEKRQIAIFWLLIGVVLFHRDRLRALRLSNWLTLSLLVMLIGNVVTVFLNFDSVSYGSVYTPAHVPYDAVHFLIESVLNFILPFVLGAAMFSGSKDLRVLFRTLVGAALVYSLLQIIELRLSPQLHYWVYGYYQHGFIQTVRDGGFRPMVFMEHGLAVALFTAVGVTAAAALYKARIRVYRWSAGWVTVYLWGILLLSKSVAAFFYSLVTIPLILFFTPKTQFRVATLLAIVVLSYPIARGSGFIPVDDLSNWVGAVYGEQKLSSIMTRFENEEDLLERASERSLFGWGGHCRSCIFDPWEGKLMSVADGDWIITIGTFGLVGFLGKYLLMLLPIFLSARQLKRIPRRSDRRLLSALALIVAFSVFDLLPNGNFNFLVYALSGALYGCSRGMVHQAAARARLKRKQVIADQSVASASSSIGPSRGVARTAVPSVL